MRKAGAVFALLLLLLFVVFVGVRAVTGPPSRPLPEAWEHPPLPGPSGPSFAAIPRDPPGSDGPASGAPPTAAGDRDPAASAGGGLSSDGAPSAPSAEEDEGAPPAFRANPRAPPSTAPSLRPGAGPRPSVGPTGLWERFPPAIPRGRAALLARVFDRDGLPVPGADVYGGPPEAAGQPAVSFGDLFRLGATGPDGTLRAERLPEGRAAIAANLSSLLNGPRGLDARSAVRTVLRPGALAEVEVRLPFALAEFGAVRGIVTGPDGEPLSSAQVTIEFFRAITGRDGTFLAPFVPAGARLLSASRSGYAPLDIPLSVAAGSSQEVLVRLEFREAGTLSLSGTVRGPEGEPVPGAVVYVIAAEGMGTGTVRSTETREDGSYLIDALPDRLAESSVRLQAQKDGYRAALLDLPGGLRGGSADLTFPVRLVRLRLTVLDAATGDPLDRCLFAATAPGADRPSASFSSRSPDGRYETWLPPGPTEIVVEAPDHEPLRTSLDAGPGGGEIAYTARLVAAVGPSASVAVTVRLTDAVTGSPVTRARVEVLDAASGAPLAALEGERPDGAFVLPAPSGDRRLRITAPGFEDHEGPLPLAADATDATVEVRLAPR